MGTNDILFWAIIFIVAIIAAGFALMLLGAKIDPDYPDHW